MKANKKIIKHITPVMLYTFRCRLAAKKYVLRQCKMDKELNKND